METFIVNAQSRSDMGKGASRRLRRTGVVPGIVYGAGSEPAMIALVHTELEKHLEHEAFYSHILTLSLDGKEEKVVLKDLQRHPSRPFVQHVDFMRVSTDGAIHMSVPLHFTNEPISPGVKHGGTATYYLTSVEVECKPADLPEYLEVDLADLDLGHTVHLTEIKLPEGVSFPALAKGAQHNYAVVAILGGRNVK
ncbi:MAG: 50S ribosomal protein L25/general stress protein Ctc [Gammaproteobacteria bacterium]|nr:50S ribosomal protein L25/general stress protein Ctc [Gammaproteobacteria bacterium]MBU1653321.1 50S ribosomal protein L25/general stress protein Ctc [Gammaproteobacteria bacterium]MBU1961075.1 50S ribosomal protein L25/general stress protein Ctc [Gammaproteobacteria bacterium]